MPAETWDDSGTVASSEDLVTVRSRIRAFAERVGFGLADVTRIVTASSELIRNMSEHAGEGEVRWREIDDAGRRGVELVFEDEGPGIADLDRALEPGLSSGKGLGMGLPGTRRLMDEMDIDSDPGRGTRITIRKWLPSSSGRRSG